MAAKLTRLTHTIAIQLHLVAEWQSGRLQFSLQAASPKLLDTPSHVSPKDFYSEIPKSIYDTKMILGQLLSKLSLYPTIVLKFSAIFTSSSLGASKLWSFLHLKGHGFVKDGGGGVSLQIL
jgi:hypothetical protein